MPKLIVSLIINQAQHLGFMCLIYLLYYAAAKSEADEQDVRFEDTADKQNEGGGKKERIQNVTEEEGGVQEMRRTTNDMSTSD